MENYAVRFLFFNGNSRVFSIKLFPMKIPIKWEIFKRNYANRRGSNNNFPFFTIRKSTEI